MLDYDKLIPFDQLFPDLPKDPKDLKLSTKLMIVWSDFCDDLTIIKWKIQEFLRGDGQNGKTSVD